jgi:hypothetical protein
MFKNRTRFSSVLRVGYDGLKEAHNNGSTILIEGLEMLLSGFNVKSVRIDKYNPISKLADGSWTGVLGHVYNGTIDTVHWWEQGPVRTVPGVG